MRLVTWGVSLLLLSTTLRAQECSLKYDGPAPGDSITVSAAQSVYAVSRYHQGPDQSSAYFSGVWRVVTFVGRLDHRTAKFHVEGLPNITEIVLYADSPGAIVVFPDIKAKLFLRGSEIHLVVTELRSAPERCPWRS